jgi:PAS domain S-box-containing protein
VSAPDDPAPDQPTDRLDAPAPPVEARPFGDVVDAVPHLVWIADSGGSVSFYSQRVHDYAGMVRRPDGSWDWAPAVHPDDVERTWATWDAAVAAGRSYECEHRLQMADGTHRWHLSRATPAPRGLGDGPTWIGTATDIHARKSLEAALTLSEARFRATFDAAAVGVAVVALDGRLVDVNDAFCAVTRTDREVLVGADFRDITHPEDLAEDLANVRELLAGRITDYAMEKRYLGGDGSEIWVDLSVSLLRDDLGAPHHLLAVVKDIGKRREAERVAREAHAFRRRVLDNVSVFVGVLTPDGTLVEANRAPLDAAGLDPQEVLGRKFWDTYWWSYSDEVVTRLRRSIERAARGEPVRYDVPVRVGEDEFLWIDFRIEALRDDDGRITHLVPSGSDLTDRLEAARALVESERRFRAMADQTPLLVWVHGPDGRQEFVNDTFCAYFGVSREEMVGDRWATLVHPDDGPGYAEEFLASVGGQRPFHAEVRVRRADGEWRWLECWGSPRLDAEGVYVGHIGTSLDVTDRKDAELAMAERHEAEQRARRRAELLSDIVAQLESADSVSAKARELVEALVPRVADEAHVDLPGVDGPIHAVTGVWRGAGEAHTELVVPVPVGLESEPRGSLVLRLHDPARRPYDDDEAELLRDVATRASVALRAARVTEEEHLVVLRLQEALLPGRPASYPGCEIAARYQAAAAALEVGGDWFETFRFADGRLGLAVGDVVGHNLAAAAAMGQLRAGLLALATRAAGPAEVLSDVDAFARGNRITDFATAVCAAIDPSRGELSYASAGHPPMLVVGPEGTARWLEGATSPPLGVVERSDRPELTVPLAPGSLVVGYSDGLVERRHRSFSEGMDRLADLTRAVRHLPVDQVCERLVAGLADGGTFEDDVVVVCLRLTPGPDRLRVELPPELDRLSTLRAELRAWLSTGDHLPDRRDDVLLAVSEAAANAVEHAYLGVPRVPFTVEASVADDGSLTVVVADAGTWRPAGTSPRPGGRGTGIMRGLSDGFSRDTGPNGTSVTLVFRTGSPSHDA